MITWPIETPAYGTYYWFLREIGFAMGYGPDYYTWDHAQIEVVKSILEIGYTQALYPVATQQQAQEQSSDVESPTEKEKDSRTRKPHSWSFLNQLGEIVTQAGRSVYDLPDDFTSNCGELVIEGVGGRIPIVAEAHIRTLLAKGV